MTKYRIKDDGYSDKPYYIEKRYLFLFWQSPYWGHFSRNFHTLEDAKAEIARLKKIDMSPKIVHEE